MPTLVDTEKNGLNSKPPYNCGMNEHSHPTCADTTDAIRIIEQADLKQLNTFGLPCVADRLYPIHSVEGLQAALKHCANAPFTVLGGGSNVLLPEKLGNVLHMDIMGRALAGETDDAWLVRVGAGEEWHSLVRWTLEKGLPGLENLSLIPGSVGAAPVQNIGAYGVELADRLHSVEAWDQHTQQHVTLMRDDCTFAYRDSIFKQQPGRYIITHVVLQLAKTWHAQLRYRDVADYLTTQGITTPTALNISNAVIRIRTRKLPDWREIGNVGSFFKNPVVDAEHFASLAAQHPNMPHYPQADGSIKLAAGWLIEQSGWKGQSRGQVGCYDKQALVLVNLGNASRDDVLGLANAIVSDVQQKFRVQLEREPVLIN